MTRYTLVVPIALRINQSSPAPSEVIARPASTGAWTNPSALRAIDRGRYARHRVFFADEATAVAAGYRPCARSTRPIPRLEEAR